MPDKIKSSVSDFDIFLGELDFKIEIQTFLNNDTRISIFQDNILVCDYAPITMNQINLAYFGEFKKGAFFCQNFQDG